MAVYEAMMSRWIHEYFYSFVGMTRRLAPSC